MAANTDVRKGLKTPKWIRGRAEMVQRYGCCYGDAYTIVLIGYNANDPSRNYQFANRSSRCSRFSVSRHAGREVGRRLSGV